jgi:hypothetical protein
MKGYVARKGDRYYAVIYEGLDPLTGRERRRWHPSTHSFATKDVPTEPAVSTTRASLRSIPCCGAPWTTPYAAGSCCPIRPPSHTRRSADH